MRPRLATAQERWQPQALGAGRTLPEPPEGASSAHALILLFWPPG